MLFIPRKLRFESLGVNQTVWPVSMLASDTLNMAMPVAKTLVLSGWIFKLTTAGGTGCNDLDMAVSVADVWIHGTPEDPVKGFAENDRYKIINDPLIVMKAGEAIRYWAVNGESQTVTFDVVEVSQRISPSEYARLEAIMSKHPLTLFDDFNRQTFDVYEVN